MISISSLLLILHFGTSHFMNLQMNGSKNRKEEGRLASVQLIKNGQENQFIEFHSDASSPIFSWKIQEDSLQLVVDLSYNVSATIDLIKIQWPGNTAIGRFTNGAQDSIEVVNMPTENFLEMFSISQQELLERKSAKAFITLFNSRIKTGELKFIKKMILNKGFLPLLKWNDLGYLDTSYQEFGNYQLKTFFSSKSAGVELNPFDLSLISSVSIITYPYLKMSQGYKVGDVWLYMSYDEKNGLEYQTIEKKKRKRIIQTFYVRPDKTTWHKTDETTLDKNDLPIYSKTTFSNSEDKVFEYSTYENGRLVRFREVKVSGNLFTEDKYTFTYTYFPVEKKK